MIEALENLLAGSDDSSGASELRALLAELAGGQAERWCLVGQERLRAPSLRVLRLRLADHGRTISVIAKRLSPEIAHRNVLVAERWLPAVGLGGSCARLLGSAAARSGSCIWQVYEDLGRCELDPRAFDPEVVKAAVELIARLHLSFAAHPLLGEVRLHGGDYGIHFYETSVQDAICALRAVQAAGPHRALCDRTLQRLYRLQEATPARAQSLADHGGPETLLHGDLWATNVFIVPTAKGPQPRLIDWDRAAVGPVSYDLSTFLLRFEPPARGRVLDLYAAAVGRAGWRLPPPCQLNRLFETAELARYVSRIIWPAIALAHDHADWGFAELEAIERWFEDLAPVLPEQNETPHREHVLAMK
jgi:Phosphotransferase enzyme family